MNPKIYTVSLGEIKSCPSVFVNLLYTNKILVLRGLKDLTPVQFWDIHQIFGTPWVGREYAESAEVVSEISSGKFLTTYGNVNTAKRVGSKSLPWHRDIPWHRDRRYPIRSLYPTKLNGEIGHVTTDFCDMDVLWDRLPAGQRVDLLNADIRIQNWYEASKGSPNPNPNTKIVPLVETHPVTGRHSILLNSFGPYQSHLPFSTVAKGAWILDCWSRSKHLGLEFISKLHVMATTEDNIYRHSWELGDLVLFDNASGIAHSRSFIEDANAEREFWRMNVKHRWQ